MLEERLPLTHSRLFASIRDLPDEVEIFFVELLVHLAVLALLASPARGSALDLLFLVILVSDEACAFLPHC